MSCQDRSITANPHNVFRSWMHPFICSVGFAVLECDLCQESDIIAACTVDSKYAQLVLMTPTSTIHSVLCGSACGYSQEGHSGFQMCTIYVNNTHAYSSFTFTWVGRSLTGTTQWIQNDNNVYNSFNYMWVSMWLLTKLCKSGTMPSQNHCCKDRSLLIIYHVWWFLHQQGDDFESK